MGYKDGEEIAFDELEYIVKPILLNTSLPLSVDIESGYSKNPLEIAHHIKRLIRLGVVGINIEDSVMEDGRVLLNAYEFSHILLEVKKLLLESNLDIFINVRIDTFCLLYTSDAADD